MSRKTIDCRHYEFKRLDGSQCTIALSGARSLSFSPRRSLTPKAHMEWRTHPSCANRSRASMADEASATA